MARVKIRYFVAKTGRAGSKRFYWQPSAQLGAQGYKVVRLPDVEADAIAAAQRLNADLDARRGVVAEQFQIRSNPLERAGLYVIGSREGPVKLGFSKAPWRRLGELQLKARQPIELLFFAHCLNRSAPDLEHAAHQILHQHRLDGEWFAVPAQLAIYAAIAALCGQVATSALRSGLSNSVQLFFEAAARAELDSATPRSKKALRKNRLNGGRTRTRTLDPLIKSQLLYQLSYAPHRGGPPYNKATPVCR